MKKIVIGYTLFLTIVVILGAFLLPDKEKTFQIPRGLQAVPEWVVSTTGNDSICTRGGTPCASLNRAYQLAQPGDTVNVEAGVYRYQAIQPRQVLRGLSPGCTLASLAQCIRFVFSGVKIDGQLEIFGSDVFIDGGTDRTRPGLDVTGIIDSNTGSSCCAPPTTYPDHILIQGTHSASFGIYSTDTMTWRDFDVGPATVSTGCNVKEGPGSESKIGASGVGPFFVPTNIVIDNMKLHNQNGDSGRIASDCHWGGLFLVNANGLTVENSIFERNVVYNVEIQNFSGPPSTNVVWRNNSFGCAVEWLYTGDICDGQSSIQFDGTFTNHTISGNVFAESPPGWGCYRPPCDFSTDTFSDNTYVVPSTTAPPLPGQPVPTTTAPVTTTPVTTAPTTTHPTTTPTTTAPVDTVTKEIDAAIAEFKATTITYGQWAQRVKSGYYGTKWPTSTAWGRAFADLDKAKALAK